MNLFAFFTFAVFAAEAVLSPLPDDGIAIPTPEPTPEVSFGQLLNYAPQVLGSATEEPQPTPTPTPLPHRKNAYTIAVLGDSMVDTLGPGVPHLAARLHTFYPGVTFQLLNYGVGGENIDSGISRLTNDYTYGGTPVPALVSQHPDIVVVESFGYNPFIDPSNELDRHWLALAKIVDVLRNSLPGVKIIIAATIAPNSTVFGDGVLNWNPTEKQEKVARVKRYLDNAVKFAKSQGLPLADAFHPSLDSTGNGKLLYINPGDHIHYSDAGRELFGRVVANAIVSAKLLE